jgi:hypothetical protein
MRAVYLDVQGFRRPRIPHDVSLGLTERTVPTRGW